MHFMAYLKNSILIAALSAGLSVAVAAAAAYAVTRLPFRGAAVFLFAVLAVSMFPQISLVSYLFKLMSALGWINTYPALVLPYAAWTLPLCLWLLVSYFARLPRDLDRAARIMPVGIAMFEGLHGELPWGEIMAAATLSTAPVVALVLAFQRRIVQGLTRGAVKQ
jgi:multiple sugar transport system permease protein